MRTSAKKKRQMLPRFRLLLGDEITLGPGQVDLLEQIARTGSIIKAAQCMNMSYNRAWLLVRTMNECFKEPLVIAARGGKESGGASLSETGLKAFALYRSIEDQTNRAPQDSHQAMKALLRS